MSVKHVVPVRYLFKQETWCTKYDNAHIKYVSLSETPDKKCFIIYKVPFKIGKWKLNFL